MQQRAGQLIWISFAIIAIVAAGVRFYCLSCSSLWHDEGNTWALIQRSPALIASQAAADIHPPGYYWLLHYWTAIFGRDVAGLRSLSAIAGTIGTLLVFPLGRLAGLSRWASLVAMLLVALSPFQIYYSQEARMYALLLLETMLLSVALLKLWPSVLLTNPDIGEKRWRFEALYLGTAAAGLWTHYLFPLVLGVAFLSYSVDLFRSSLLNRSGLLRGERARSLLIRFLLLHLLIVTLYLPWLPTALTRLFAWPAQETAATLSLFEIGQHFLTGPMEHLPELGSIWVMLLFLPALAGLLRLNWKGRGLYPGLSLILFPLLLGMAGFHREAFVKFYVIVTPAWAVSLAALTHYALPFGRRRVRPFLPLIAFGAVLLSLWVLPGYWSNPNARDDYAGMARIVEDLGDPDLDRVVLNAPGQAEVWRYYSVDVPFLALPEERPANRDATESRLAAELEGARNVFVLLYGEQQSDPEGVVEGWLDRNAFRGWESWQGDVRFRLYRMADDLDCDPSPAKQLADLALVEAICRSEPVVEPGSPLLLDLRWRAARASAAPLKTSLQLLDERNQVVAQLDGEPAGGQTPTTEWTADRRIEDRYGLFVPVGTPPGRYRLVFAVYESATGRRVLWEDGEDALSLGEVEVTRPARPLPVSLLDPATHLGWRWNGLELVGYSVFPRGFEHEPDRPLRVGDQLHVILFWRLTENTETWPEDLHFHMILGDGEIRAPLAGGGFPTGEWRAGDLVRAEFDIPYPGGGNRLQIEIQNDRRMLGPVPVNQ